MKIYGIIVAMEKEITYLKNTITNVIVHKICNLTFFEGLYNNCKVVFTTAGIGKVNAGITTILMIEHFSPDLVINTGIAGGYRSDLKPLDIVIADKVIYSDVDMTCDAAGNFAYGQLQNLPKFFSPTNVKIDNTKVGTILTGDQFVYDYNRVDSLVQKYFNEYDVIAFDMESGSIAQVCTLNNVEFMIVRAISDIIGSTNAFDYLNFSTKAVEKVSKIVLSLIK